MEIPFHRPYITDDEINAAVEAMRNGWITMGGKTVEFEEKFNKYIGCRQSVALNSGTAALHLALHCINLKAGEEVIIPAFTFAATAEVVRYFNAIPVMVDAERDTHLIDAEKIEKKITSRTKAIIPVHYAGQPADMDQIKYLADKYNLFIIEDAAHSLPSIYKGKKIGTIGDITCFSFYATKTITTGEGGMAVTDNADWADRMRVLRLHGISRDAWKRYSKEGKWEYDVTEAGYKYNTTDINSAMGIEQLKKADHLNKMRADIAFQYNEAFKDKEELIIYHIKKDRDSSNHLYPIKLNLDALKITRDQFIDEIKHAGINVSVHFIPLYRFNYYKNLGYSAAEFPESEWIFERCVSLPIFPGMTKEEIDYVVENVDDIIKKNKR